MKIHEGWFRSTEKAAKPARQGIPPQECSACHDYFIPANGAQVYCTAPNCVRDRATKRQQERRHLQRMMQDADQKRQRQKDELIASVNAVLAIGE